jgi:hypothetical protein
MATGSAQATQKPSIEVNTAKTAKTTKSVGTLNKQQLGVAHHGANSKSSKSNKNISIKPARNKNHHDVWFHSIDIEMLEDPNHNGYNNRLIVNFDADTHYASYDIYAVLALTDSNGITSDYFVTDDFYIYGESGTDDYEVDTVLTSNWIADGYDLSISLYDAYSHDLVAYIDAYESNALADLHLESVDYEYLAPHQLTLFSAESWLIDDQDNDGYYHTFNLDLDIDNNYGSSDVYLQVFISEDQASWESLYVSEHFIVNEDDISDKQHLVFELQNGYPPGYYHIRVEVIDANSHMTLLTLEPQSYSALYALPLEDMSYEAQPQSTTPAPSAPDRTSVSHESGGSLGAPLAIFFICLCAAIRRRRA